MTLGSVVSSADTIGQLLAGSRRRRAQPAVPPDRAVPLDERRRGRPRRDGPRRRRPPPACSARSWPGPPPASTRGTRRWPRSGWPPCGPPAPSARPSASSDGSSTCGPTRPRRPANPIGWVHAPSLDQATTGAVLRGGELAHGAGQTHVARIDLTSDRVRTGAWIVDAVHNGATARRRARLSPRAAVPRPFRPRPPTSTCTATSTTSVGATRSAAPRRTTIPSRSCPTRWSTASRHGRRGGRDVWRSTPR